MVLSLAFILAFIGSAVALLIGILIFSEVEGAIASTFGVATGGGITTDSAILYSCDYPSASTNKLNQVALPSLTETFPSATVSISGQTMTGSSGCVGMAQDPTTSIWYQIHRVSGGGGAPHHLVTLDINTGVGSTVGSLTNGYQTMAFDKDGNLYIHTNSNSAVSQLEIINKATGAIISTCDESSSPSIGSFSEVGLVYDYNQEKLYIIEGTEFFELTDTSLADCGVSAPTTVTGFGITGYTSFTYDTVNSLIYVASQSGGGYRIVTLDPVTAVSSLVTNTSLAVIEKGIGFELSSSGGSGGTPQAFAQASNVAFTVIGILPVALFFALFAIFSGRTE